MVTDTTLSGPHDFQGMDGTEQFRLYFRQHWIRMLWAFFWMTAWLIFCGAALAFISTVNDATTRHAAITAILALFIVTQGVFLVRFYRHFLYVIIVSDRKIHRIKRTFLAVDDHQSIDLASIQDIRKSQHGPVQNLFGFGTITLEAQESVLRIHFVPKISRQYELILGIRRG